MAALDALLTGLVDYAGLFPPAGLDMRAAVRAYDAYRRGPHTRLLGSFVVPAARLDEFGAEAAALGADRGADPAWMVSVVASDAIEGDVDRALKLASSGALGPATQVIAFEVKADTPAGVARATALVPRAMTVAVEIPLSLRRENRRSVLRAVNPAKRWISRKRGASTARARAAIAGLNRSVCPTITRREALLAASRIASASSRLAAIGFSMSTSAPERSNSIAPSRWWTVGVATLAAATLPARSDAEAYAAQPYSAAISRARSKFASATPTRRHFGFAA